MIERIRTGAAERDQSGEPPFFAFDLVREYRIGALRVPTRCGGPGGTISDVIEIVTDLASADPNVAHALRNHFNFVEYIACADGVNDRDGRIGSVLNGNLYGAAVTEIGTERSSDITTSIRESDAGFLLNGRKYYATGTAYSDYVSVLALNPDGEMINTVIPLSRPGVQVRDDWDGMGQRLTASGGVDFVDVRIGRDEVYRLPLNSSVGRHASAFRQLYLAACIVGIMRNVVDDAVGFVRNAARPIAHSHARTAREDYFVQQVVGEMSAQTDAAGVLLLNAAERLDRNYEAIMSGADNADDIITETAVRIANTQVIIAQIALKTAESLFDVGGGSATSRKRNYDRHWRNVRTILSHNPIRYKTKVVGDYLLNGEKGPLIDGRFF